MSSPSSAPSAGGVVKSTCTGVERSVYWAEGKLFLIDQRLLPGEFRIVASETLDDVVRKIKDMTVRGAPAIGAAGAFALVLAANNSTAADV